MDAILIVDDNARLRNLLRELFSAEFPEARIIEAASGEEAIRSAATASITLAIMDIGLPGMNGIEASRALIAKYPKLRVIILSIHEEERYRREAGAAGVLAFVPKRKLGEQLVHVIHELLSEQRICA